MQLELQTSLPRVRYCFTCEACPERIWELRRVRIREQLSQPYAIELELLVDPGELDLDALLAASCELLIDREAEVRSLCGVIERLEIHDPVEHAQVVHLRVVPALALLGQRVDTRAWQDASALAVVEAVLREALADYDRELDTSHLQGNYASRPYVVQYHESDLDFVARLLEDEGIAYRFDHERGSGREVLVLEDSADHWDPVPTLDGEPTLPLILARHDQAEVESVQHLRWARAVRPSAVRRQTFDWRTPMDPIAAGEDAAADAGAAGPVRAVYHHGGPVDEDPQPRVVRELAHARAGARELHGVGNAIGLAPGRRLRVDAPSRPELDGLELLILELDAVGDCPEAELGASGGDEQFSAKFRAVILGSEPWRPPLRAPVPRIHGPQTAIVTGPEGEEIHTDEHGRIKVRFEWDRVNGLRDDTSMWIRVVHGWAGAGFGALFLPRIGMEVVVEFIAGDPARPLVTGCVYNGEATASVALPDAKTQSTIRTRSSPGGEGYNELRFEDAAGSEEIFVHAQRNLREVVGNSHTVTIGGDRTETIRGDVEQTVEGNHKLTVEGTRDEVIQQDQTLTYEASRTATIMGEELVEVYDHATHNYKSGRLRQVWGEHETKVFGANAVARAWIEGDLIQRAKTAIELEAGARVVVAQGQPVHEVEATMEAGAFSLTAAETSVRSDQATEIVGLQQLTLSSQKQVLVSQGAGWLKIDGQRVDLTGSEITLRVGATVVTLSPTGLTVTAPKIEMTGHQMVKIN